MPTPQLDGERWVLDGRPLTHGCELEARGGEFGDEWIMAHAWGKGAQMRLSGAETISPGRRRIEPGLPEFVAAGGQLRWP